MHIPDGYLSPGTCAVFFAGMLPVWYIASRRVEATLKLKELPLLSLGAAFTFVVMMFNIPIPGGSTGHMVGSTVLAVMLGPWAGVVALSLTLTLQAFIFGDGGIIALGANCFNMAFLMSFSGYYIYRLIAAGAPGRFRKAAASALAAYVSVNIAALAVALELGVQPFIAHGADGRPLYAPYPLSISVPAMMLPHLFVLGPVEALGTALIVSYILRTDEGLLYKGSGLKPLWAILAIMIILVPIGLLSSGTPWGEWGRDEVLRLIGYVPAGMGGIGGWKGVMPGYGAGQGRLTPFFYILSALGGSVAVVLAIYIWGKIWRR